MRTSNGNRNRLHNNNDLPFAVGPNKRPFHIYTNAAAHTHIRNQKLPLRFGQQLSVRMVEGVRGRAKRIHTQNAFTWLLPSGPAGITENRLFYHKTIQRTNCSLLRAALSAAILAAFDARRFLAAVVCHSETNFAIRFQCGASCGPHFSFNSLALLLRMPTSDD